MTADEVLDLPGSTLVLLADGKCGMLIGYPYEHRKEALVQVPKEEQTREVLPEKLHREGKHLKEEGARVPPGTDFDDYVLRNYLLRSM